MKVLQICPICGKAYLGEEDLTVTCSCECRNDLFRLDKADRKELIEEAKKKKRPARTDCRAYDKARHDCNGLNALWCEAEDCKFYKPKKKSGVNEKFFQKIPHDPP